MNIVITGANGFIGSSLVKFFIKSHNILAISEKPVSKTNLRLTMHEFLDEKNLSIIKSFEPTHFIHTAAIAHRKIKENKDFLKQAIYINQSLPTELYLFANKLGIRRFIFLSTIGVLGFRTNKNECFNKFSKYNSYDFYSELKKTAEKQLIRNSKSSKTELIIFRPTVVYGKNSPGNFNTLTKLIDYNFIFPLSMRDNKRSLLYIDNLLSAISKSLIYPINSNKIFLLSDKETISTCDLIRTISKIRNKRIFIFKLPPFIFNLFKKLPFIKRRISQLTDDLVVDPSNFSKTMEWEQPYSQKYSFKKSFSEN
tara:strand:- start:355 stop:1287 length:933 start_codon:yes stop_codon:yes gene_type:complete